MQARQSCPETKGGAAVCAQAGIRENGGADTERHHLTDGGSTLCPGGRLARAVGAVDAVREGVDQRQRAVGALPCLRSSAAEGPPTFLAGSPLSLRKRCLCACVAHLHAPACAETRGSPIWHIPPFKGATKFDGRPSSRIIWLLSRSVLGMGPGGPAPCQSHLVQDPLLYLFTVCSILLHDCAARRMAG